MNLIQHYARFSWHSWTGQEAWHDIKLYRSQGKVVAVITEPVDRFGQFSNPGQSVTNGIEEIARQLRERGHDPDILVEHYPARGLVSRQGLKLFQEGKLPGLYPETEEFSLVALDQTDSEPQWKYLAREQVNALIGSPFPEWHQERGHVLGEDDFKEMEEPQPEADPHNDNLPHGETEHMRFTPEPMAEQIILRRMPDGSVQTNIPWRVQHHSPTGYEWGYGGSGPADLALNILENVLLEMNYEGALSQRMFDGRRVFQLAWSLHQEFKQEFIAPLPRGEDATISTAEVLAWLHLRLGKAEDE